MFFCFCSLFLFCSVSCSWSSSSWEKGFSSYSSWETCVWPSCHHAVRDIDKPTGCKCLLCKHQTMSGVMVATITAHNGGEHGAGGAARACKAVCCSQEMTGGAQSHTVRRHSATSTALSVWWKQLSLGKLPELRVVEFYLKEDELYLSTVNHWLSNKDLLLINWTWSWKRQLFYKKLAERKVSLQ